MLFSLVCLFGIVSGEAAASETITDGLRSQLKQKTTDQLERRIEEVDGALKILAGPSMRTGVGAIGYRSSTHTNESNTEWVQVDLGHDYAIDQIVLVPAIWRDTQTGYRADGFPVEFQIVAGTSDDPVGEVIADFGPKDFQLPRVAPVVIRCEGTTASWVRCDATKLSPRAWDDRYLLELSEMLVFSGPDNVALRQPVEAFSTDRWFDQPRSLKYLVDGFVPYLMDAYHGDQSIAYVSEVGIREDCTFTFDLEIVRSLDRIHLHATDLSDTVPQGKLNDFGIPPRFIVQGAIMPDFSDAVDLVELQLESIFDLGPIIMRRFPATDCRYVRLVVLEPYLDTEQGGGARIGFAEIELFAGGQNMALGRKVEVNFVSDNPVRPLTALTDGNNLYGRILPVRLWLAELAQRHDLETERPLVVAELNKRYQRQKTNIKRLAWLTGVLALVAVGTIVIERIVRNRAIVRTREQIAADVHDELGANIHAIGLLGDMAMAASESPSKLKPLLLRMRELTERTGTAARYCANLLESEGLFDNLEQEMRRTSSRIMADLKHEITFDCDGFASRLSQRKRIDLYLFHKECLINIIRHSNATEASTILTADHRQLCLTVTDNGRGISALSDGVPKSLRRRARLLGAQVAAINIDSGGTKISLMLRL